MKNTSDDDEILAPRPNLDFSRGQRGKSAKAANEGTNIVIIELDLLDTFPDAEAVNDALRGLKQLAQQTLKTAQASSTK